MNCADPELSFQDIADYLRAVKANVELIPVNGKRHQH